MATALTALVILDIQHLGRPGKNDLGASHDLDGDGLIEQGENEAELTPIYADAATKVLLEAGIDVVVLKSGAYSTRWKRAAELAAARGNAPVAYIACHLNAGGGDYGLVCFDPRSSGGARLAREIGAELFQAFSRDELRRVIADDRASTKYFPRAQATIDGIYAGPANLSGVCFEPLFLDDHDELLGELTAEEAAEKVKSEREHEARAKTLREPVKRELTRGELRAQARQARTLDRIGRALAAGVSTWLRLRAVPPPRSP